METAYIIRSTDVGYELAIPRDNGSEHVFLEPGGHGPLERLYAEAENAWHSREVRTKPVAVRVADR